MRPTSLMMTAVLVFALAATAVADWYPEDPSKWVQLPDLEPDMGINVNATGPYILADDFLCEMPGYITNFHIWGSWYHDVLPFGMPEAVGFTLSLHADIPAEQSPTGYSMPGEVLAVWEFAAFDFAVHPWQEGVPEGWMEPPDFWEPGADFTCWQYNFEIPLGEEFFQEGSPDEPIVYWLDVQAHPMDPGAFFGWKTSIDHWNDDAVWVMGEEPYEGEWFELIYPPDHPYQGESIDLAFVVQTGEMDWGDAPDPTYPTLASSNGATHLALDWYTLGPSIDGELDGLPHPNALGDDLTGIDDEDGVVFTSPLVPGQTTTVDVEKGGAFGATLNAWVDFNKDGDWFDGSEQIFTNQPLAMGVNNLSFAVPADAVPGQTFARFRLTYFQTSVGPTGPGGLGEVEDHEVFVEGEEELDWGDAPDGPYPTLAGSNGANHNIVPGFFLGALIDPEPDGQPHPSALGDDLAGLPDEDGVVFTSPIFSGQWVALDVTASAPGFLDAWLDFGGDGSWAQASDQIFFAQPLAPGVNNLMFAVPVGTPPGVTFARFRFGPNGALPFDGPGGMGEVEDYEVFIEELIEDLDWGDAPDAPYPTLAGSNGANHVIVPGFFLGGLIDAEPDGQPDPNALGDDLAGLPDEDGVVFTSPLFTGQMVTLDVTASGPGLLDAWIDFGGDGSWAQPGDQIFLAQPLAAGVNNLSFMVPVGTPPGVTFARFRFGPNGGVPFDGPGGFGEVEDYEVFIEEEVEELDWGDADDPPFPTLATSNGASHVIVPGIFMGASIDADPDGQPTGPADGDDLDGNDDEDGVIFTSPIVPGQIALVDVTASVPGFLDAWIDFEGDGSWVQASNQIFMAEPLVPGMNSLTFAVPGSAVSNLITTSRFRFSTNGGLPFDGPAADGEVEDYIMLIDQAPLFKWVQFPDLEPTGIDVAAFEPFVLADDFLCTEPGRITEITIWGSWLWDEIPDPGAVQFTLSIHEDIPEDESPTGYSMPGELLWLKTFAPFEFYVDIWAAGIEEGWLEPPETYIFPADSVCWMYTFVIEPHEAFHQVGMPDDPIVYWLDVQALPEFTGAHFGWKTSLQHWNDDAVWGIGIEPYFGPWEELRYPPQHPFFPESIDLAFGLNMTYGTDVPEGEEIVPQRLGLYQNVPNPFNPTTVVAYDVPAGGSHVTIEVFDVNGRLVSTLVDEPQLEGRRSVAWHGVDENGRELPSGVYFYRMTADEYAETRKMLLLK